MTPLETALVLSYLHSDQLIKNLETALIEMKALKDPRAGKFQSLLEKLSGASKRAFENVSKNIENKSELDEALWDMVDNTWDSLKNKKNEHEQK